MCIKRFFDFDGRYVLAAGDNDVLRAVFEGDIAVRMPNPEVTCVEPSIGKGFLSGVGVFQIAFHHDIAAHHHLAHGLCVFWDRLHSYGIGDH